MMNVKNSFHCNNFDLNVPTVMLGEIVLQKCVTVPKHGDSPGGEKSTLKSEEKVICYQLELGK